MSENTQIAPIEMFDKEQVELIKRTICNKATDDELKLFINQCKRTRLDPFSKQIWFIKNEKKNTVQIMASIDGLRLIAERTGNYAGQEGPFWCGGDGIWKDIWLAKEYPRAAKVGVLRHDWKQPKFSVAKWEEYAQIWDNKPSFMWGKMPAFMLAKTAEALALRSAFPNELSGLYSPEEIPNEEEEKTQTKKVGLEANKKNGNVQVETKVVSAPATTHQSKFGSYTIDFGKYNHRTLDSIEATELADYIVSLEKYHPRPDYLSFYEASESYLEDLGFYYSYADKKEGSAN